MAALGVIVAAVGVFVLYEAVKSPTPTPLSTAKAVVAASSKGA